MASSQAAVAVLEEHRQQQARLAALTMRTAIAAWPMLRRDQAQWLALLLALVRRDRAASAALARNYMTAYRVVERAPGTFDIGDIGPMNEEQVLTSLMVTGPQALERARRRAYPDDDQTSIQMRLPVEAERKVMTANAGAVSRHVLNGGREVVDDIVQRDPAVQAYMRLTDGNPCYFCSMLASRGPVFKDRSFERSDPRFSGPGDQKVHDGCVVGETSVAGPRVEVGFRRRYEGEMVVLRVAGGNDLTITPNHPVLTPNGWIPAGLLREGDHLLRSFEDQSGLLAVPDQHQEPSLIADLFSALAMMFGARRRGVPVAPEEFHGDGVDGEVYVVDVDGLFADRFFTELSQPSVELALSGARAAGPSSAFSGFGLVEEFASGPYPTSVGLVGPCGHPLPMSGSLLVDQQSGLSQSARGNAGFQQYATDDASADVQILGEILLGLSGQVTLDGALGEFESALELGPTATPRFDPPPGEFSQNGDVRYATLGGALSERLAGHVQTDRIVESYRIGYSGHVYNLQTAEGWYAANGIIASNCGCSLVPIYGSGPVALTSWKKYDRLWQSSTQGTSGKAAIRAFRQAYSALG